MAVDDDFTLGDSFARWWRWFGGRRIVTVVLGVPGAALLGWWLLRVPPTAVEATLPFSDAVVLPVPSSMPATSPAVIAMSPPAVSPPTVSSPDSVLQESGHSVPLTGAVQPVIYVHVVGAVGAPGVYALPIGSRGDDAVRAAGGALPRADLARVNLAAPLADAVQVFIPQRGETRRPPAATVPVIAGSASGGVQEGGASAGTIGEATTSGRVRLNVAGVKELDALPGIGPATAAAIVDHRRRNGPFHALDDLDAVNGIGPARIAALRDLVVVD